MYDEGADLTCRKPGPYNALRDEHAEVCYSVSSAAQPGDCTAMNDIENLHRKCVADFRYFDPDQRIWSIYLREAAEKRLERNDDP